MGYTALWGPKGFIVSTDKIVPLNDLVTSIALKQDSENDTSGTAQTNTRGKEPQTISLSTVYVKSAGVDPRSQIEEWSQQVGNAYPLYIGGIRFGPPKLKLTKVDVTDILLSPTGVFLSTKVAVTLEEYNEPEPDPEGTPPTGPRKPLPTQDWKKKEYRFATYVGQNAEKKDIVNANSMSNADNANITSNNTTAQTELITITDPSDLGIGTPLQNVMNGFGKMFN